MRGRPLVVLPLVLFGSGCAVTTRAGGQIRSVDGAAVAGGDATLGGGLGFASDRFQLTFPTLSLSVGERLDGGANETALEVGGEYAAVGESGLGFRTGPRIGAGLLGTTGAYAGIRAGPTFTFATLDSDAVWAPTLTLEGLVAVGLGGELGAGGGVFGATLSFGFDHYAGQLNFPHGRPLRDGAGRAWLALAKHGRELRLSRPSERLGREARKRLAAAWLAEGLEEHASIASFLRLALELETLGAPASLVRRALKAAVEEAGHARACFALADRHLGREHLPGKLPPVRARRGVSLEALAVECWVDGCLGEGTAASVALARARRSSDPGVRRVLTRIAREEAQHAELAWSVLADCVARGGDRVRDALRDASARDLFASEEHAEVGRELEGHGLHAPSELEHARVRRAGRRRLERVLGYGTSEFKYSSRFV